MGSVNIGFDVSEYWEGLKMPFWFKISFLFWKLLLSLIDVCNLNVELDFLCHIKNFKKLKIHFQLENSTKSAI